MFPTTPFRSALAVLCLTLTVGGGVFAPSFASAGVCGDGIVDPNEQCDPGTALFCNGDPAENSCVNGSDCQDTNCYFGNSCCKFNCQFVGSGADCHDGNECTADDQCNQVGECVGNDAAATGLPCDDGLFCTATDTCDGSGTCSGSDNPCDGGAECQDACDEQSDTCNANVGGACTDDGNPCTDDICDENGNCSHPPFDAGAACDDGMFCTANDTCDGQGTCVGAGDPCAAGGQCASSCDDALDTCDAPAGTACDDGLFCTATDTCDGQGVCSGTGDPCAGGGQCADICDDSLDTCNAPAGTGCDDGLFCTATDTCDGAGACSGSGDPCANGGECADTCDDSLDTCNLPPGTACSDDGNVCTDDSCNGEGLCEHAANTAPCDDGLFCTDGDVCSGGQCQSGAPRDCSDLDSECGAGTCNDSTDACEIRAVTDGTACDDGLFCTTTDECVSGVCTGSGDPCAGGAECQDVCSEGTSGPECNAVAGTVCSSDSDVCTDDVCDGLGSCTHPLNTAPCEDGDPCTAGDTCSNGTCISGGPNDCDDDDICTFDSCEPNVGCINEDVTLRAACDWVVVGGTSGGSVQARAKYSTTIHGDVCADRGDVGERVHTVGSWIGMDATSPKVFKVRPFAVIEDDLATGGGSIRAAGGTQDVLTTGAGLFVLPGQILDNPEGGVVDTTGTHSRLASCDAAQLNLDQAAAALNALPSDLSFGQIRTKGTDVPPSFTITAPNVNGLNVIDLEAIRIGGGVQFILDGGGAPGSTNDTVFVIRVEKKFKTGINSAIVLANGTQASNVVFLGTKKCQIGKHSTGAGVILCHNGKGRLREGTVWDGALLSGKSKADLGELVTITHQPFLAF